MRRAGSVRGSCARFIAVFWTMVIPGRPLLGFNVKNSSDNYADTAGYSTWTTKYEDIPQPKTVQVFGVEYLRRTIAIAFVPKPIK